MSEVLSQSEIDNLLTGIKSGELKNEELADSTKKKDIYEYDFRRPTRVSKDQLKTIRTLHESFTEIFGFYLASRLQTMATIELLAVDQLRYSEYVLSITNPGCIYIYDVMETEGRCVLEMNPELVYVIVERLLGGSGAKPSAPRSITTIEQRLMKPLIQQALLNLTKAWQPITELNFKLSGFESNPDFVQIAPASEIVIVISCEIRIGEDSFMFNICYPSFALEDVIAKLGQQYYSSVIKNKNRELTRKQISAHLENTPIEVRTLLGSTEITLNDLLNLEKGDVICLDTRIDEDLPVYVRDRMKFAGRPGIVEGNVALKITQLIND